MAQTDMDEQFLHGIEIIEIDVAQSQAPRGAFPYGTISEEAVILCSEVIPE